MIFVMIAGRMIKTMKNVITHTMYGRPNSFTGS